MWDAGEGGYVAECSQVDRYSSWLREAVSELPGDAGEELEAMKLDPETAVKWFECIVVGCAALIVIACVGVFVWAHWQHIQLVGW